MVDNKLILSPEYEQLYSLRYNRQPKYIPVGYVSNRDIPNGIEIKSEISRIWIKNAKAERNSRSD